MAICYWCSKEVAEGEGAREHIVPRTLLQDVSDDVGELVIPAANAHEKCNRMLADTYEHDFCQIIFHYTDDEEKAKKHAESKKRNLGRRLVYAVKLFGRMRLNGNRTEIQLTPTDKKAFEECIRKILKGLYFKQNNRYLDLQDEYYARVVWNTFNLEHDPVAQEQVKRFLELLGPGGFRGNEVFKFRFRQVEGGQSSVWELLFYDRFPVYIFLIHCSEKEAFNKLLYVYVGLAS